MERGPRRAECGDGAVARPGRAAHAGPRRGDGPTSGLDGPFPALCLCSGAGGRPVLVALSPQPSKPWRIFSEHAGAGRPLASAAVRRLEALPWVASAWTSTVSQNGAPVQLPTNPPSEPNVRRFSCDPACHRPRAAASSGPPPSCHHLPWKSLWPLLAPPSPLGSGSLLSSPASRADPQLVCTSSVLAWTHGAWNGCRGARSHGKELEGTGPRGALVLEPQRRAGRPVQGQLPRGAAARAEDRQISAQGPSAPSTTKPSPLYG